MFITIIVFVLVLSLLVFVHEFGHYFSARRLGVKSEEFGFGFPPRIFGIYKNKEGKWTKVWGNKKVEDNSDTIYSINSIIVGGFVKIKGQDGEDKEMSDSFSSKKIWKRAVILASGVFMNIVLAWVIISAGFMIGFPQSVDLDNLPAGAKVKNSQVKIAQVLNDSPALEAGLKSSDVIVGIEGQTVRSSDDVVKFIEEDQDNNILLTINRSNEIKEFNIVPKVQDGDKKIIGIAFSDTATISYTWYQSLWEGVKMTGQLLWAIVYAFYDLIRNLIIGQGATVEVAGPIGIADLTGQMVQMGFIYLLQFTALLSLNLAIINILPFPALDGGRLLFLLIEKIKGKPVKQEVEAVFHNIGFILLMALVVWVTFKDIINIFG
ncbi:MAG TPA: RIP metalloprotease RseP [bacterium]|nr:RIP metalloprotease RseP [bacterium]